MEYSNNNNNNDNTSSYKPFAESNYIDENDVEDEIIDTLLSPGTDAQYESTLLMQLKQKLESVPIDAKTALVYAQQVTDFVDDDHLLGFLYAERFNVDVSIYMFVRGSVKVCTISDDMRYVSSHIIYV